MVRLRAIFIDGEQAWSRKVRPFENPQDRCFAAGDVGLALKPLTVNELAENELAVANSQSVDSGRLTSGEAASGHSCSVRGDGSGRPR
jgi:hypothetical protein